MKQNIVYLRTSTEDQTPENQLNDVISLLDTDDYEVIIEKQSAFKDDIRARPQFKRLINGIKEERIKILYAWDIDRLYRNRLKFVSFWRLCKLHNVKVVTFRQQWLNELEKIPEPFNEMVEDWMINFYGWIAEEESKKKSERIKIAYKNHKGKKWGRPKLKVNKYEILRLREEGKSIREISNITGINRNKVHKIVSQKQTS